MSLVGLVTVHDLLIRKVLRTYRSDFYIWGVLVCCISGFIS